MKYNQCQCNVKCINKSLFLRQSLSGNHQSISFFSFLRFIPKHIFTRFVRKRPKHIFLSFFGSHRRISLLHTYNDNSQLLAAFLPRNAQTTLHSVVHEKYKTFEEFTKIGYQEWQLLILYPLVIELQALNTFESSLKILTVCCVSTSGCPVVLR